MYVHVCVRMRVHVCVCPFGLVEYKGEMFGTRYQVT